MGVNQLLINPVLAAFGQFIDVQFAGSEHHLAQITANLVAVDVDVGKIIVSADLLNLAQRILQCLPIPKANVL